MSRLSCVLSLTALLGLSAGLIGQTAPGKGGKGYLGVFPAPVKESGEGVMIREVSADSPAATAGLKDGDIVFKVNGKDVPDVTEFYRAIGKHKPGDKVNIQVQRGGLDKTIAVTLGTRPADEPGAVPPSAVPPGVPGNLRGFFARPAALGVKAEELTADLRKQLKIKAPGGVLIAEVESKSPAAKAGLERNDVIVAVNGQAVKDPDELRGVVQKAGAGKTITLRIQRGGEEKDVQATLRRAGAEGVFPGGPGRLIPGGPGVRLPLDIESLLDQSAKIRDLERRVEALQKRVNELEKRSGAPNK